MIELGLSNEHRCFLRHLHLAEKQLNVAFSTSREGGALSERVSQVYRDLYGTDCSVGSERAGGRLPDESLTEA